MECRLFSNSNADSNDHGQKSKDAQEAFCNAANDLVNDGIEKCLREAEVLKDD